MQLRLGLSVPVMIFTALWLWFWVWLCRTHPCGRVGPLLWSADPSHSCRTDNRASGGRVRGRLGPSVPVMIFTALWSWFWVWLCRTHPCGRAGPLLWSAGPSHSCRTDNRTSGGLVQLRLGLSVPVMIFTALWSWFWVWLYRTHPCGRLEPLLWSAGPSHSCRTDNQASRGRVQLRLGLSVPVMIFTALWSWFWVWLCRTHPCGRAGPLMWSAGPSHSCRTDNRASGGRVQLRLGLSVPVMIFTALWSWFWVWLCRTHPCGRVGPLLWSADPSHSCRTDNRTSGGRVLGRLGPSVPVMIFTALWSWFWVGLCRTHPCGRAGPLLWSAGPSHSCRMVNRTRLGYILHNDIHSHGFNYHILWLLWALLWSL